MSSEETPRAPRLTLFAVVAIQRGKTREVYTVSNISESGVLLQVSEEERTRLPINGVHEITVFDRDDEQHRVVKLTARVVRHDPIGVAMTWNQDAQATKRIAALLAKLNPRS